MTHNLDTPAHVYSPAEIDRLADVMTDYMTRVHGSSIRQIWAAERQAEALTKRGNITGNLVLDWARVTLQFVLSGSNWQAGSLITQIINRELKVDA